MLCTLYTVQCSKRNVSISTVFCTVYSVVKGLSISTVFCTVYCVQFTVYSVQFNVYSVHCSLRCEYIYSILYCVNIICILLRENVIAELPVYFLSLLLIIFLSHVLVTEITTFCFLYLLSLSFYLSKIFYINSVDFFFKVCILLVTKKFMRGNIFQNLFCLTFYLYFLYFVILPSFYL